MSDVRPRILIVDDDPAINAGLEALLGDGWEVATATTGREAIVRFGTFSPDAVLLDIQLPDMNGLDVLDQLKRYAEGTPVIVISGVGTFDRVVEAMKLGAETFLQKPFDYATLEASLTQAQQSVAVKRELTLLRRTGAHDKERLPGISPAIAQLNELLAQIARAPSPVLIEGESGTGKGVFAKLIHRRSPRASKAFVDLNCAGLSKELLESELFGHERGAFTAASSTKPGLFEIASDGTLFLDEIAEMDITVQARVLKAVEEKRFRRVGGVRDLAANFRLIVTTNRDLQAEVAAGRFRRDLYYRLNVVRVRIPPLRERMEDLPILVDVLLPPLAREQGLSVARIHPRALQKLQTYRWPGNVRELRNVLERALLGLNGNEIRTADIMLEDTGGAESASNGLPSSEWEIRPLDDVIADYVRASVEATGGNMRKAARQLQISPSTLYAKLKSENTNKE